MSQQMRRTLAAVGFAAALLLAVPAPSQAATFQGPVLASRLVEKLWTWVWSVTKSVSVGGGQTATPPRTGGTTPATPPPSGTDESGSMIDPDGKP